MFRLTRQLAPVIEEGRAAVEEIETVLRLGVQILTAVLLVSLATLAVVVFRA